MCNVPFVAILITGVLLQQLYDLHKENCVCLDNDTRSEKPVLCPCPHIFKAFKLPEKDNSLYRRLIFGDNMTFHLSLKSSNSYYDVAFYLYN